MKKSALTIAISSLLLASGAHAATVYNQNDSKLEIGGRVHGMYYASENDASEGDKSYFRLNMRGETKVANELTAFGFGEYNMETSGADNNEVRYAFVGMKHDRFGTFSYGRQDGLFTIVNDYTDVLPEWGGDGLGKGTDVFGTGRTNGVAKYVFNQNGLTFGVQMTGENTAADSDKLGTWNKGSDQGYAVVAAYDFDMGLGLSAAYNQARKTDDQVRKAAFGGNDDAMLMGVGAKYAMGDLYLAATYSHGENHQFVNGGYADQHDGYEAVAQYTFGKFKPSVAYLRTDVQDTANGIDDTLTEYVSIGAWYNFTSNVKAYVDYKINLLDEVGSTNKSKLGQKTDDTVAFALQYNF
jgi:predicted porin